MSSSRPYRVLHLIDSLGLGGAQVVLLNLIRHANREHFQIDAACLHGRGVFWEPVKESGAALWSLSFHHYFPSYVPILYGLMRSRKYDVVHCHLLGSNVIGKPLAALAGVPVRINHDHCNDKLRDPRPWALPADRWANRFAAHVIAVSESTRTFVEEHEGVPRDRTSTIYNGIDCERFSPRPELRAEARKRWGLPDDAFVIGGVGRLAHQKNFQLFLRAAAAIRAKRPSVEFVISGTGEEESDLRSLAGELGISEHVRFLGFVGQMESLYPTLDALMLTSRYEGLPMTVLEAMASGVPIIAPRLDGIAEILVDGEEARLVSDASAEAFADAVYQTCLDSTKTRTMADRALAKVRSRFSSRSMTERVEKIYLRYLQ